MRDLLPILHGYHGAPGVSEWLMLLLPAAGIGTALAARWLGRLFRGDPSDRDEPI